MRFVVYGPGAIGGTIGGRLFQHGHPVVLVARGAHLGALRAGGLTFRTPDGEAVLDVPVVGEPREVDWAAGDVAVLAMKSQDTRPALEALAAVAPPETPVVCAQNGVANERAALRLFENVYGMCVVAPASYLEPGVVEANGSPTTGVLDLGRYPSGSDAVAEEVAAVLSSATFSSQAAPEVMRWKYRKLLSNLGNAVEALCGPVSGDEDAAACMALARDEGAACLAAAGIDCASWDEDAARRGDLVGIRPAAGRRRAGGSTWQSLQRGLPAVESDYLNGEIVLLGRLHGMQTPVNRRLQERMRDAVRDATPPGSLPSAALRDDLSGLGAA